MKKKDIIVRIKTIREQNDRVFKIDIEERITKDSIISFKNKELKQKLRKVYPLGYYGPKKPLLEYD